MGGERKTILLGLVVVVVMGIAAVYLRLWTLDYSVSSADTELLRRQFDLANREAMDESAEWRLRFDKEAERANRCANELLKVRDSLKQARDTARINQKLEMLQKENMALLERVEVLNKQLEAQKLKCGS